jgi:hypothetical protein
MQTPIEATFTQHARHIALILKKMAGQFKVAPKAQGNNDGRGAVVITSASVIWHWRSS